MELYQGSLLLGAVHFTIPIYPGCQVRGWVTCIHCSLLVVNAQTKDIFCHEISASHCSIGTVDSVTMKS